MVEISSLDDQRLAAYRFLPQRSGRLSPGDCTIVESEMVVRRLLQYPWSSGYIESALLESNAAERLAPRLMAHGVMSDRIFVAPKSLVEQIVGYPLHRGVFVAMRVPPQPALQSLPLPAVMTVGVSSATNIGSIARSAAAFGFRTLICDAQSASPWLRRCLRVSMGAMFQLVLYHAHEPTEQLFEQLRRCGARLVGAEVSAPHLYSSFEWSERDIIVFGSEGSGLDAAFLQRLDAAVRIPMNSSVESLNVAAAAAIIFARFAERRGIFAE
ncbi:MAG: RNA methyltransferase [Chlorobi bacterium]|nr:RNA methyltransferase [Chlorobiota bacterium]